MQHEDLVITKNLLHSAEITLENTDNHVTINYFSDEILNAKKTSFAYRIREINSGKWIEVNDWKIQFIDLSDGQYTLDVKAKNFDGIWGNHSSIQLKVLPSPWATSYAYAGYFLCFIVLFIGRDQYLKNLKRKLENIVEARTSEITTQKELAEKDKAKIGEQRDLISKSLKERESLLKEIHHRVKNNLQIIASLLYMQSGKFENEDFKRVLEEGQGRVRSMALIHQKLYENSNLKNIPFDEYLWELIREVQASYGTQQSKIALEIEAHNIHFDVETAVPLGLIVNEMAT
ncbi:MAG: histidine kinase dimerization/phosphoacceptor domain -containing protein, partial [Marinoscillum sp.]